MMRRMLLMLVVLSQGLIGGAESWWEARRADVNMELEQARSRALEAVVADPSDLDAVAAAAWWLDHLDNLSAPGEILDAAAPPIHPELSWILGLIESRMTGLAPPGTLEHAELIGPWGRFGQLDLARLPIPRSSAWPAPGTPWSGTGTRYRVAITPQSGLVAVPPSMQLDGFVLAAWTLDLGIPFTGWMAIETRGDLRVELDGTQFAEVRFAGRDDPGVAWFRVTLDAGRHRLTTAMAPQDRAGIRVRTYADDGGAVTLPTVVPTETTEEAGGSSITPRDPSGLSGNGDLPETPTLESTLRAAQIAKIRRDIPLWSRLSDRALIQAPDEPLAHLSAAEMLMDAPLNEAAEILNGRAADHLRRSASLPAAAVASMVLAGRTDNTEDARRFQEQVIEAHPRDVRALRLRLKRAVERRWSKEALDTLADLEQILGPTDTLERLKLLTLEDLEFWADHRIVLESVAQRPFLHRDLISTLAERCSMADALQMIDHLRRRIVDPDLDLDAIRLLLRNEQRQVASDALESALTTWGAFPAMAGLKLTLEMASRNDGGTDGSPVDPELFELIVDGSELPVMTLAWQKGWLEPFWRPFEVDLDDITDRSTVSEEDVDTVLLLDQAVERVAPDGSSLYYYHGISKAVTPAGARQASNTQPMPGATRLELAVIKPDGTKIVPAEVNATSRGLSIGEVEVGDLIEEEYVAPVPPVSSHLTGHLSPYVYRFADSDRAFGHSEFVLLHPNDLEVSVEGMFTGLEVTTETHDGTTVQRWRSRDVPATPTEPFGPPVQDLLPWVSYSSEVDWTIVGDTLRNRLIPVLRSSMALQSFAEVNLTGATPDDRLRSLVSALLEAVENGRVVLDLNSTAGASLSRGRGNRLGLLASLLVTADWDVDLVLTRPRALARTHLGVPSSDLFTIPVLRVGEASSDTWVDISESVSGVGHLSAILQGSDGLVIPLSDPARPVTLLSELPTFENPQLEEHSTLEAVLSPNGTAELTFTMRLRDAEATRFIENLNTVPIDQRDVVFSRMALGIFPGAQDIRGSTTADGEELEVQFTMMLPDACTVEADRMECRGLSTATPLAPRLASLPSRQQPLILQLPVLRRDEVIIQPPPGWTSTKPPRRLNAAWGRVTETIHTVDGVRSSTMVLTIPATTVAPEAYPEFARFCRAVDELMSRPPSFERAPNP